MNALRIAMGEGSWTQMQVTMYEAKRLEKVAAPPVVSQTVEQAQVADGLSTGAVQGIIKQKIESEFLMGPVMLGLPLIKLGYQPPPAPKLSDTVPKISEIPSAAPKIASAWGIK